jgi:hypothetical protein
MPRLRRKPKRSQACALQKKAKAPDKNAEKVLIWKNGIEKMFFGKYLNSVDFKIILFGKH